MEAKGEHPKAPSLMLLQYYFPHQNAKPNPALYNGRMCGILALFNLSQNRPPDGSRLMAGLSAMRHRGPDGLKYWLAPDGQAALGHARLAIVAVRDGDQPLTNEDQSLHLVVNGELYDHINIGKELVKRGHTLATSSDSEIALHLYEEYGLEFLNHLRGEFALCLYDVNKERLIVARDRFGIKPVCYAVQDGQLMVASETKALFAMGLAAEFDDESVFHTLNMQYVLPDRTLFKGVKQLPPGHFLLAQDGQIRIEKYFDLDYPVETIKTSKSDQSKTAEKQLTQKQEQELISQFAEIFEESVRLRLFSEFPVVCHLSGGLDSSSVLAMAAKNSSAPIDCFTVAFEEEGYNELDIAKEMAAKAGGRLHIVPVTARDIVENLEEACFKSEGLAVNGHLTAKHLLNKAIHQAGFRVSLTGEGADEVLAGYPHLRSDILKASGNSEKLAALHAANPMSKGIMLASGRSLSLACVQEALGYVPGFLEAKGTLGYKMLSVANEDFLAQSHLQNRDAYKDLLAQFDLDGQIKDRHPVHQSLYLWSKTALANYILRTLGDGVEMGQSLEGRLPFLDHKLFEFLRTVPMSMKIHCDNEKYILKEAMKPYITDTIYNRHKHPFVAPPVSRFAGGDVRKLIREKLASKAFANIAFYDQTKVLALFDRLENMDDEERAATDPVFMTALSYLAIQERLICR